LNRRKLIRIKNIDDKVIIELTEKGKKRKLEYDINNIKIKEHKEWDEKWRMVIFDIPENRKSARDALRRKLKNIGFIQFQRSVWIFPYPCEDEIDFINEYFGIGRYVNMVTAKIDNDRPLRKAFKLSS